jgi:hypothetical protein
MPLRPFLRPEPEPRMNPKVDELLGRIKALETELEAEISQQKADFRFRLENRKVRFEQEMLARQRQFKVGLLRYLAGASWRHLLSALVIYPMIVPIVLLDAGVSLYQALCFPLYRIAKVRRGDYFAFDREQLAYLNLIEKVNCTYCAYTNGLIAYVQEVVARTEQYWCPIKHARRVLGSHQRYARFVDFGDAESYRKELDELRKVLEREAS